MNKIVQLIDFFVQYQQEQARNWTAKQRFSHKETRLERSHFSVAFLCEKNAPVAVCADMHDLHLTATKFWRSISICHFMFTNSLKDEGVCYIQVEVINREAYLV